MARKRFGRRSSGGSSGVTPGKLALYAAGYGAVRAPLSNLARQVGGSVVGSVGDEVILGAAGYFMATRGSGAMRDFGRAMLTVEAYTLGRNMSQGAMGSLFGGMSGNTTTNASIGGATF